MLDRYHMNNDPQGTVEVMEEMARFIWKRAKSQGCRCIPYSCLDPSELSSIITTAEGYLKKARELEEAA